MVQRRHTKTCKEDRASSGLSPHCSHTWSFGCIPCTALSLRHQFSENNQTKCSTLILILYPLPLELIFYSTVDFLDIWSSFHIHDQADCSKSRILIHVKKIDRSHRTWFTITTHAQYCMLCICNHCMHASMHRGYTVNTRVKRARPAAKSIASVYRHWTDSYTRCLVV